VWRSDDGGETWWHPERPQPTGGSTVVPGALLAPNVYDLLISPASPDVVLAATGRDARRPDQSGIYRSVDGAQTWTRVHQFTRTGSGGVDVSGVGCLAVAPDNPNLMFAAGGFAVARSTDGGATWTDSFPTQAFGDRVWHVVAGRRQRNRRRVYAVGSRVWYSLNGGVTWREDPQPLEVGFPTDGSGPSCRTLAIHPRDPRVIYLKTQPWNPVLGAEEDLFWRGEYPLITSGAPGTWRQLPAPRKDYDGTTASGGGFIVAHVTSEGRLYLFASDRRTVHFAASEPTSQSDWTRVEDGHCHMDPHGLALTPDFHRRLPSGPEPPRYGRILLVNDGGANYSTDGARTWRNGRGLSTLSLVNVAINPVAGKPPAICMGMGDNSGFSSPDGGQHWETQDYVAGDNDCCVADPREPSRLFVFAPRHGDGSVFVYSGSGGNPPDASHGTSQRKTIPCPPRLPEVDAKKFGSNIVSSYYHAGYRPLVLTPRGEQPRADGDFIAIRFTAQQALLLRTTRVSAISSPNDWVTSATAESPSVKVFQQGPPLPSADVCVVQASGGHTSPVYYVGDPRAGGFGGQMRLWKWTAGMTDWQQLVPGPLVRGTPVPAIARRYFVDPYRPSLLYVLDRDHVRRSDDGGATWVVDTPLERALTENGAFPFDIPDDGNPGEALVRDMLFDPDRPGCRFAVGPAGVFHTLDGLRWVALLRSSAMAIRPNNAAYDIASCPRALYVATSNRGLLRLSPIAPDWDYPMDSLQAAQGKITLLRVHDKGSGYGPPQDRLDAEVVVWLDTEPEKAFGFQLRDDADKAVARGMLDALRDAFNRGARVRLEFSRSGCRTGRIIRVIQT
jgi:hypothetical protein